MGGVHQNDVGQRHVLHHAAAGHLQGALAASGLEHRIAVALLHFVHDFLAGHHDLLGHSAAGHKVVRHGDDEAHGNDDAHQAQGVVGDGAGQDAQGEGPGTHHKVRGARDRDPQDDADGGHLENLLDQFPCALRPKNALGAGGRADA